MKEVKEVVHVPTRELAEEVLRVGAENGLCKNITDLDVFIKSFHKELCFSFNNGVCVSSTHYYYDQEKYKIITAQEFLNRYKPKFRPIAMRCTQKQFEAVKDKLVGCEIVFVDNFNKFPYLVNDIGRKENHVSNSSSSFKTRYDREVFEEWNEKTFLECCGIEVKDEVNELDKLRKENESLKKHYNNVEQELKHLNNELSKELGLVKKQLKAIEDQPKVGDVCLFWDNGDFCFTTAKVVNLNKDRQYKYASSNGGVFENCIKATPENIQSKINELKND